ncbi:hypothetical protein KR222_003993 [Zaprionus bogoriensis]|nr:hypothetical protein KR222_003993 [Zaprionus bogoriensis]
MIMIVSLCLVIAACALAHWLNKISKDYIIAAFFSRRVRTKDGRAVESIAPIPKGLTIFANCFDLYGKDEAAVFQFSRKLANEMGKSYLSYSVGMPLYNVIDADNIEFIMNNPNLITKGRVYDFMKPALRTGLLTASAKKWQVRRKLIMPTFHINILAQFLDVFKTESAKFVQQFQHQQESIISLTELIPKFTLNCICETAMGIKLDDLTEKGDRYRNSMKMLEKLFVKRLSNPLHFNRIVYNILGSWEDAPFLKVIHDFSSEIIAKRRILLEQELDHRRLNQLPDEDIYVNERRRFAMLDTLICAEKDGLIDHDGICEEVDTLMFGGFDTTSFSLVFILMNLALHLEQQELCYKEIQECIYGNCVAAKKANRLIVYRLTDDLSNLDCTQLTKLKYLECCIMETFRIHPVVPLIVRQTLTETEFPNGLILPASTQILIHVYDLHHNAKYWERPGEFDPERFLPHNKQDRHPFAYMPFSGGQRNCMGQKYAMMEMKTFLIFILKQFKVLPITMPDELVFSSGFTLCVKTNVQVKLVRRNRVSRNVHTT